MPYNPNGLSWKPVPDTSYNDVAQFLNQAIDSGKNATNIFEKISKEIDDRANEQRKYEIDLGNLEVNRQNAQTSSNRLAFDERKDARDYDRKVFTEDRQYENVTLPESHSLIRLRDTQANASNAHAGLFNAQTEGANIANDQSKILLELLQKGIADGSIVIKNGQFFDKSTLPSSTGGITYDDNGNTVVTPGSSGGSNAKFDKFVVERNDELQSQKIGALPIFKQVYSDLVVTTAKEKHGNDVEKAKKDLGIDIDNIDVNWNDPIKRLTMLRQLASALNFTFKVPEELRDIVKEQTKFTIELAKKNNVTRSDLIEQTSNLLKTFNFWEWKDRKFLLGFRDNKIDNLLKAGVSAKDISTILKKYVHSNWTPFMSDIDKEQIDQNVADYLRIAQERTNRGRK